MIHDMNFMFKGQRGEKDWMSVNLDAAAPVDLILFA